MAKYHTLLLVHKTKRILAVTMELPIICIWHIASASNLAQRQQWNFSTRHLALCNRINLSGYGWLKPDETSSSQFHLV